MCALVFRPSVRLSARKNSVSNGQIFVIIDIWIFFKNLSKKLKIRWNMRRIKVTLHKHLCMFVIITRWILLKMRRFSNKILEKIKTDFLFPFFPPRKSCRFWQRVEKYDSTRQATADNTAYAHWMLDNQDHRPNPECAIIVSFP